MLFVFSFVLLLLGMEEKEKNEQNLEQIPVRVNVNGIRGKSTATRLITAILAEAGFRVVGKTTGSAARMIYWNKEEEKQIIRKPRGISLVEQVKVINEAAEIGANALVCECMAVRPEYQKVYQHNMVKANITVIVNVLEDHLEEMGPTLDQIAWAFADTIPYNGIAVIPDCEYTTFFQNVAKDRGSTTVVIDDGEISPEFIDRFDYRLFEHNCAVALSVARALGIPDEISFRGMLNAHPDPGALRIHPIRKNAVFVNAFAANEPSSSLEIWNTLVEDQEHDLEEPIVVMNCRPDRIDRTQQFARDFFQHIPNAHLLVIGEKTSPVVEAYEAGQYPNLRSFKCIEGNNIKKVMDYLEPRLDGKVILGVGNIHGIGEDFIHALLPEDQDHSTANKNLKEKNNGSNLLLPDAGNGINY